MDEVKDYAEGLLLGFSQLLAQVGPGKHTFDLRISPRCVIDPTPGENPEDDGYGRHESYALINGCSKTTDINTDASPETILRCVHAAGKSIICILY